MHVTIVNQREVDELLPMRECIEVMETILRALAQGECILPLRQIMWLPDRVGALGLMPSFWAKAKVVGLKAVTFFPGNEGTELDSHQGSVMLFESERGRLLAIVDATAITAIRTAGVSGAATKLLAREDAATLAIIGSGVQAARHLEAMLLCRPIREVRVCSKTLDRAAAFAVAQSAKHSVAIKAIAGAEDAVQGADIICTTTTSPVPVLLGDWLSPGVHINAVGSSIASARELDAAAVRRCRLFVDRRESALNEAGDFVLAKAEGAINDDHILGEIGEVLTDRVAGRTGADEITLFKSVGLAVEDLASAWHVYQKAADGASGVTIPFGGSRHEAP